MASPSKFYSRMIDLLKSCSFPGSFAFDSKSIYKEIFKRHCSLPVLPRFWCPLLSRSFSLPRHWSFVTDSFTENHKSDLSWLITLRAVKVRESLRNWGYIENPSRATCSQTESIDHCFRACPFYHNPSPFAVLPFSFFNYLSRMINHGVCFCF